MDKNITIAVDAMGGDGAPKKIIDGINDHSNKSNNVKYLIFGNKDTIVNHLPNSLNKDCFEIIDTKNNVEGKDTPLVAARRGKDTSRGLNYVNKKDIQSAGNTGALLVISKLNLKMIES